MNKYAIEIRASVNSVASYDNKTRIFAYGAR